MDPHGDRKRLKHTTDTVTGAGILRSDIPNPHTMKKHTVKLKDLSKDKTIQAGIKKNADLIRLTHKQERFAEEYMKDMNAGLAAKRAGYSPGRAGATGCELCNKPDIKAAIQKNMDERSVRTRITADRILLELACIGMLDIMDIFDAHGNIKNIHDMPEETRRALGGMKIRRQFKNDADKEKYIEEIIDIKTTDKLRALELMGKHIGMFKESEGNLPNLEGLIAEARERARIARKTAAEIIDYEDVVDNSPQDNAGHTISDESIPEQGNEADE